MEKDKCIYCDKDTTIRYVGDSYICYKCDEKEKTLRGIAQII